MIIQNKNVPAHFLFDSLFNSPRKKSVRPIAPNRVAYNIVKNENGFTLEFAIPGFSKEDFTISMEEDKLLIKLNDVEKSDRKYTRKEFDFSTFEKKFNIPSSIDTEKISASYEKGILSIVLKHAEKITKNIDIH